MYFPLDILSSFSTMSWHLQIQKAANVWQKSINEAPVFHNVHFGRLQNFFQMFYITSLIERLQVVNGGTFIGERSESNVGQSLF